MLIAHSHTREQLGLIIQHCSCLRAAPTWAHTFYIHLCVHLPYGPCCATPAKASRSRYSWLQAPASAGNRSFRAAVQRQCCAWCFGENSAIRILLGDLKVFQGCVFKKGNFLSRWVFWNRRHEGSNPVKCNVSEGKLSLHLDTNSLLEANLAVERTIIVHFYTAKEMGDGGGPLLTLAAFDMGTGEEQILPVPSVSPLRVIWMLQFEDPHRSYNPSSPSLAASSRCRKPQFLVDPKHSRAIWYYCLG